MASGARASSESLSSPTPRVSEMKTPTPTGVSGSVLYTFMYWPPSSVVQPSGYRNVSRVPMNSFSIRLGSSSASGSGVAVGWGVLVGTITGATRVTPSRFSTLQPAARSSARRTSQPAIRIRSRRLTRILRERARGCPKTVSTLSQSCPAGNFLAGCHRPVCQTERPLTAKIERKTGLSSLSPASLARSAWVCRGARFFLVLWRFRLLLDAVALEEAGA